MPAVRRPWTVRLIELIEAGVTDREELIRLTIPYVPEGHAYRHRERMVNHRLGGKARQLPRRRLTLAEIHRIGARDIVSVTLRSLTIYGTIVRDGDTYRLANGNGHR